MTSKPTFTDLKSKHRYESISQVKKIIKLRAI